MYVTIIYGYNRYSGRDKKKNNSIARTIYSSRDLLKTPCALQYTVGSRGETDIMNFSVF